MCSQCGGNNNKDVANVQLIQDVISIKSYLQKLRRILHEVITRNFLHFYHWSQKSLHHHGTPFYSRKFSVIISTVTGVKTEILLYPDFTRN